MSVEQRERDEWAKERAAWVERVRRAHDRAVMWQGKFHSLRLENNALRKRLRAAEIDRLQRLAPSTEEAK